MSCTINWNKLTFSEWEQRFNQISRANLLQSPSYAHAVCPLNNQKPRWGLISIDEEEAGLIQIIEAGLLKNLVHAVLIDRAPLWFDGYGRPEHIRAFIETLSKEFPRRFGRKRRFIPEIEEKPNFINALGECGWRHSGDQGYQTIWLDLRLDQEDLRQNLKKNWRGGLNKAEKAGLSVEWDETGQIFPWLLECYLTDKKQKNYDGPSPKLLSALAGSFAPKKNMLIGRALMDNKPIAAILVLCHGSSATYQLGWTSEAGRDKSAHHLLLWDVLDILKNKGIKNFDLGGVNDESAGGVKKFKQGMGGQLVTLPGLYT